MGSKDKIRSFFEANVGKVVTTQQIRKVAGVSEYARRLRELRDEEGMQIKSHIDRHDLKPGQYILEDLKRVPSLGRGISPQLRNEILERNGFTCQLCGSGPGDADPFNPNRKIRLNIDHIIPLSQGGSNKRENLRVLCSACNLGRKNIQPLSESALNILARIRRLPRASQQEVFDALKKTFETK
jgi:hypothetical protein